MVAIDKVSEISFPSYKTFETVEKLGKLAYTIDDRGVRGGSRAAATSKVTHFVIIVNGFQPLTIITKWSTLDVAAVLDPPLGVFRTQANI